MIENSRDEEVCRRWDALADEDHTYHLSEKEYFHYKNKWWLHSNKQGSNTMPLRHCSDFKQALSTLKRLQPRSWRGTIRDHFLLEAQTMVVDIEFFLYRVAMARLLVVFLRSHRKSRRKRQAKACDRSGQPVAYRTLANTSDEWLSRIRFMLLQLDRLQLTAVHCNRRGV